MPSKRKRTRSDDPAVRRAYEQAGRLEEEFLVMDLHERLDYLMPPKGWRKQKRRGRPRKKKRGGQEVFGWKPMVIILLLKERYEMTYREIAGHVHANPLLQQRLHIPRAPSHGAIKDAEKRIPEAWWKRLNRFLVGDLKGGRPADRQTSMPAWIRLDVPSKE